MTQTQPGSMLEKLALAALNSDREAAGFPPVESRECVPDSDGYVRNAVAMLKVLRNAMPGMIEAGHDMLTERGCNPLTGDAEAVFQVMIDVAMEGGA